MAKDLIVRSSSAEFLIFEDKLMIKVYKSDLKMEICG